MAIAVKCGDCGKQYTVDEKFAGKRGKCKQCGAVFDVPRPGEPELDDSSADGGVDLNALSALEQSGVVDAVTPGRRGSSRSGTAMPAPRRGGSAEEDFRKAPPPIENGPNPFAFLFRNPKVADLIRNKLPVLLILLGYGLPVVGMVVGVLREGPLVPGLIFVAAMVALVCGVVLPAAYLGVKIGVGNAHVEMPERPVLKVLAAFAPVPLFVYLFTFSAADAAGLMAGDVTGQQKFAAVMSAAGGTAGGLIVGLALSMLLLWLLFEVPFVKALITWLIAGISYTIGGAVAAAALAGALVGYESLTNAGAAKKPVVARAHPTTVETVATSEPVAPSTEPVVHESTPPLPPPPVIAAAAFAPGAPHAAPPAVVSRASVPPLDDDTGGVLSGARPREHAARAAQSVLPAIAQVIANPDWGNVRSVARAAGGQYLAAVEGGPLEPQTVRRIDLNTLKSDAQIQFPADANGAAGASYYIGPDGAYLVRFDQYPPKLVIWSFADHQVVQSIDLGAAGQIHFLGFASPTRLLVSGRTVATGGGGGTIVVCDAMVGTKIRQIPLPEGTSPVVVPALSPDGRTIAAVRMMPPQIDLYDAGGAEPRRLGVQPGQVGGGLGGFNPQWVQWTQDGHGLAVLDRSGTGQKVTLYRPLDGSVLLSRQFPEPRGGGGLDLRDARLTPDAEHLIAAGGRVVELKSGRSVGQLGFDAPYPPLVLPDGRLVAPDGKGGVVVARLDADKLQAAAAVANKSGGGIASPPDLLTETWPTNIRPRIDRGPVALALPDESRPAVGQPTTRPVAGPLANSVALAEGLGRVRGVFFARPEWGRAVVSFGGFDETWDPHAQDDAAAADGDGQRAYVQRIDLAGGKVVGEADVPARSRVIAASPDGEAVLLQSASSRDPLRDTTRLDVWSISKKAHVNGWSPYAQARDAAGRGVRWASMPDADHVVTLNGPGPDAGPGAGGLLIGWSVAEHRAAWAWDDVRGTPVPSRGRRYLFARIGLKLRCLLAADGMPCADLEMPGDGTFVPRGGAFSADGKTLAAVNETSAAVWDMTTGKLQSLINAGNPTGAVEFVGPYVLVAQRPQRGPDQETQDDLLLDPSVQQPIFTYRLPAGREAYGTPDGRHWYVAPGATDVVAALTAAAVPSPEDLAAAQQFRENPPLIHPGVGVALQVNVEGCAGEVGAELTRKLTDKGVLVNANPVATLRLTSRRVQTDRKVNLDGLGASPAANGPHQITAEEYDCDAELFDATGRLLRANPTRRISAGGGALKEGQSVEDAYHQSAIANLRNWGESINPPAYVAADGANGARPEADWPAGQ